MSSNQRLLKVTVATVVLFAVLIQTGHAQQSKAVSEGARVYGSMCGRCHNPRSPLERSDRDWVTIINHMRVRGNLTGGQVRDVLAFLKATNSDPREPSALPTQPAAGGETPAAEIGPPSSDSATVTKGRALIGQFACVGCHVVAGAGGQLGPSLNGVMKRRNAAFVRQKLADPTFDKSTSMMPNFGLSQKQIEAIVAYLATLGTR